MPVAFFSLFKMAFEPLLQTAPGTTGIDIVTGRKIHSAEVSHVNSLRPAKVKQEMIDASHRSG
jgi:hypothetical protein